MLTRAYMAGCTFKQYLLQGDLKPNNLWAAGEQGPCFTFYPVHYSTWYIKGSPTRLRGCSSVAGIPREEWAEGDFGRKKGFSGSLLCLLHIYFGVRRGLSPHLLLPGEWGRFPEAALKSGKAESSRASPGHQRPEAEGPKPSVSPQTKTLTLPLKKKKVGEVGGKLPSLEGTLRCSNQAAQPTPKSKKLHFQSPF